MICNSIQLTIQLTNALRIFAQNPNLPEALRVPTGHIHAVCSHEDAIPEQAFLHNKPLQEEQNILVFCKNSFDLLEEKGHLPPSSMMIADESHLTAPKPGVFKPTHPMLYFSATPNHQDVCSMFKFTRQDGINAGIITPLMIDNSLPDEISTHDIVDLIKYHDHPDKPGDNFLVNHKGLIYLDSKKEVDVFYRVLQNKIPDLPLFKINADNADYHTDLRRFKQSPKGIAFAIRLLKEGFDDHTVDWLMLLKKQPQSPQALTQMLGRILRKNLENLQKIGLAIMHESQLDAPLNQFPEHMTPEQTANEYYVSANRTLKILKQHHPTLLSQNLSQTFFNASEDDGPAIKRPCVRNAGS